MDIEITEENKIFYPGFYEGRIIPHGPFLEEWKDIIGFEGHYKISNYGRVKCLHFVWIHKDKKESDGSYIIKKRSGNWADWYQCMQLITPDNKKYVRMHILVGQHFLQNPENKKEINHIRGFKNDNCFTQLEWATSSENKKHAFKYLGYQPVNKGKFYIKPNSKKVKGTSTITGEIKIYDHCASVKIDGFSPKSVQDCFAGRRKRHKILLGSNYEINRRYNSTYRTLAGMQNRQDNCFFDAQIIC